MFEPLPAAELGGTLKPPPLAVRAAGEAAGAVPELAELERLANIARAAGAGQASGPEELGP